MKYIFVNLKRFDIPKKFGGINSLAPVEKYGSKIILDTQDTLKKFDTCEFEIGRAHV